MPVVHFHPIEHTAYELRIGPPGWKYGEPYDHCLVLLELGDGTVEVRGLDKPMTPAQWRAVRSALIGRGYTAARFERRRADGRIDTRTILPTPPT